MIFLYILGGFVLLAIVIGIINTMRHYVRTNCSVCGAPTGFKGNKRYKLSDGYMCGKCAVKTITNESSIKKAAINAFSSSSKADIAAIIKHREEVGDEQWRKEKEEERAAKEAKMREARLQAAEARLQATAARRRWQMRNANNTPRCARCGSTSITANQKGYGIGKAVIGAAIAGPIGLVGGNIGARKVRITCLSCGHQWIAGKG